jgi:hypothetical protein
MFLSSDLTKNKKIRKDYSDFVEEVALLSNETSSANNSCRTMFNIISQGKDNDEMTMSKIKSYFGSISNQKYMKLKELGKSLASNRKTETMCSASQSGNSRATAMLLHTQLPSLSLTEFNVEESTKNETSATAPPKLSSDEDIVTWLWEQAKAHMTTTSSSLSIAYLVEETVAIASRVSSENQLQERLFELVGEMGIDYMISVVEKYNSIKSLRMGTVSHMISKLNNATNNSSKNISGNEDSMENLSANQKRKKLQKQQKLNSKGSSTSNSVTHSTSSNIYDRGNATMNKPLSAPSNKYSGNDDIGSSMLGTDWLLDAGFSEEYLEQERMLGLPSNAAIPESWLQNLAPEGTLEYHEKRGLPAGTIRTTKPGYEEYFIPAPSPPSADKYLHLRTVSELEPWAQLTFRGTDKFNPIQSKVFDTAYNSSENMLICAPTGAGNEYLHSGVYQYIL